MNLTETIKELSLLPGISGQESAVRDYLLPKLQGHCTYQIDPLGNILVFKKGAKTPKNKLYFSAHMDEVGFLITGIDKEGYLRFTTVGGIDPKVIFGKAVLVGKNALPGIIGGKPIHLTKDKEESSTPIPVDKLLIDIGANSKEEAEAQVHLGDYAVYHAPFFSMGTETIVGKALDDRAGCALLLQLIQGDLPYDCHFGFTVQEEIGCIGGQTAAYSIGPDIGIVVESTTAGDIGGVPPEDQVCRQGSGPVLSFRDRGAYYNHSLYREVLALAKEHQIPCQSKEGVFGGNEARVIQTARGGAAILGVSLPTRYLHSPSSTLNTGDITHTLRLLTLLVEELANR